MKTQYFTATSVDGFIADEHNSLDWLLQLGDESGETYEEFIAEVGAIAMGATTYERILHHHVAPDADQPRPWAYNQPCWVFSHREFPCARQMVMLWRTIRIYSETCRAYS